MKFWLSGLPFCIAFIAGGFVGWQIETARWWLVMLLAAVACGIIEGVAQQVGEP